MKKSTGTVQLYGTWLDVYSCTGTCRSQVSDMYDYMYVQETLQNDNITLVF